MRRCIAQHAVGANVMAYSHSDALGSLSSHGHGIATDGASGNRDQNGRKIAVSITGDFQPQGAIAGQNRLATLTVTLIGFILWALCAQRITQVVAELRIKAFLNAAEASSIASAVIRPSPNCSSSSLGILRRSRRGGLFGWHTCTSYSCYARTQNF